MFITLWCLRDKIKNILLYYRYLWLIFINVDTTNSSGIYTLNIFHGPFINYLNKKTNWQKYLFLHCTHSYVILGFSTQNEKHTNYIHLFNSSQLIIIIFPAYLEIYQKLQKLEKKIRSSICCPFGSLCRMHPKGEGEEKKKKNASQSRALQLIKREGFSFHYIIKERKVEMSLNKKREFY